MIKRIKNFFWQKLDNYILEKTITATPVLTEEDHKFLLSMPDKNKFLKILDKLISGIVWTSCVNGTPEALNVRSQWVKCLLHLKSLLKQQEKKATKKNPLTNEELTADYISQLSEQ